MPTTTTAPIKILSSSICETTYAHSSLFQCLDTELHQLQSLPIYSGLTLFSCTLMLTTHHYSATMKVLSRSSRQAKDHQGGRQGNNKYHHSRLTESSSHGFRQLHSHCTTTTSRDPPSVIPTGLPFLFNLLHPQHLTATIHQIRPTSSLSTMLHHGSGGLCSRKIMD